MARADATHCARPAVVGRLPMGQCLRRIGPRAERVVVSFVYENAGLLAVSMVVAVLAYGYAIIDPSLSLDEQIAPAFGELGHGHAWNLALYRWGTVAFDFAVLGAANLHVLRPLLALTLLSVAATIYARLLPTMPAARYFFCLMFVTVPTFAYAMAFSFQSVEFAMAILLFVLGLKCLVDATSGPWVSSKGFAATLALWMLAASFYQDYGIVVSAWLIWMFFRAATGNRTELLRQSFLFGALLCASAVLDLLVAQTVVHVLSVPHQTYLAGYLDSATPGVRLMAFLHGVAHVYLSGAGPGRMSLAMAAVALPLLAASVPGSLAQRGGLVALAVTICFAPLVYGLGSIPPMRASSGLLFVVAGAAAFAVARSPSSIAFFVKCVIVYLVLQNCVSINNVFHYRSLAWEADKAVAVQLASRIYEVAPDVHGGGTVRVLFVGSYSRTLPSELQGQDLWVGGFDTWGENRTVRRQRMMSAAGVPAFRLATEEDYRAALPVVESMPAWPDPRSVARVGDVVIVKLGPANGFGQL